MKKVYCQEWEESERDWGCRPDGHSLHLTKEDFKTYFQEYWKGLPDKVPDEYDRPCGIIKEIEVDDDLYQQVKKSKHGIRTWSLKLTTTTVGSIK